MSGERVRMSGTAWRCMFEPMSARFASSFSRNGISEAATETSWFGDTSISVTSSGFAMTNSPLWRHEIRSSVNLPFLSMARVRLGDVVPLFLERRVELDLVGHACRPSTLRYGVSMKPNSLTRA